MVEDNDGGTASAGSPDDGSVEDHLSRDLVADLDAGFAELVRMHGDLVFSVAHNLTRGTADAEDLAADTLLRAYRALRGYSAQRIRDLSVRPWLMTILRNAARNRARDAARRPAPPPMSEPRDASDSAAGPAEQAERAETRRELGSALAELPEVQRTAVVLRHVVGLPTGEVAQVLGCKDGTAKSHISRGLQRLRALLTETMTVPGPRRGTDALPRVVPVTVNRTAQPVLASGERRR
ncbi:RNA polymerase sigma factor [Pseudonocardia sp. CA-142604]|uniref:RNA polymerase sigma factor n=1 Tax=Pseudonocardia sp. CA-142604 TaxID=3240024 RepID=UPI003D8FA870